MAFDKSCRRRVFALVSFLSASALALPGCGGGSDSVVPDPPASTFLVEVSPDTSSAYWGHTSAFQARVTRPDGVQVSEAILTWTTGTASVAQVSDRGVVSHHQPGDTTVTANYSGATGSAAVRTLGFAPGSLQVHRQDNCALGEDHADIWCWGDGYPLTRNRPSLFALTYANAVRVDRGAIPVGAVIRQVSPGFHFSCALTETGAAYCWDGASQSLADMQSIVGNVPEVHLPQRVLDGDKASNLSYVAIKASHDTACGLASDGNLFCWGRSSRLPQGVSPPSGIVSAPYLLAKGAAGTASIQDFAIGVNRTCIVADGQLFCARNNQGSFEALDRSAVPTNVQFRSLKSGAGGEDFMGVLGSDGWLYMSGSAFGRRFGDGSAAFVSDQRLIRPMARGAIPANARIVDFAIGGIAASNCALADNGRAYCWGANYFGSLGDGSLTQQDALLPVEVLQGEVPNGVSLVSIECGTYHCTAMGSDRLPYSWGYAENAATGQIPSQSSASPRLISRVDLR